MTQINLREKSPADVKAEVSPAQRNARRLQKIEYIRGLTGKLCTLAKGERAEFLEYLLSMAYIEASDILRDEHAASNSLASAARART